MSEIEAVLRAVAADDSAALERWFALLRIPSVSAQPAHAPDCLRAAEWLRAELAELGFTAEVLPTVGQPCVLAHHEGPGEAAPHLLYYGHYDVQPAEPLALWTSPPFTPSLVEGPHGTRVVARGAVDDKGQLSMWLEALRAWHRTTGGLPARVSVLIEGEEEIGSPSLEAFLHAHRTALAADVAVISDTGMWDIDTPAITTRLRGIVYLEVSLRAAARDLHSGLYGGSALNPLNALTRILGDLHDAEGRVQIPGFYDGVAPLPPAQAAAWAALDFNESAFLGDIGLSQPAGEAGLPALERLWARPTADINGLWGGYSGPGSKTVIPAEAHAKISFRLVPGQQPAQVIAGFERFLEARRPADAEIRCEVHSQAPGIEMPAESRWMRAAQASLTEEYGRPAVLIGSGGSIPVVDSLRRVLGIDSLLMGFGLADDQAHSPDEKFELRCFRHGIRAHARLLARCAA